MDHALKSMLDQLKQDPARHVSVINFVHDNDIRDIRPVGSAWIIRGTSDRDWVYLVCSNREELEMVIPHLGATDTCFGAVPDWMIDTLAQHRNRSWDLLLTRFDLPDTVLLPAPEQAARLLTTADAETIYRNSAYRDFISVAYIQQRILRGPGRGIERNGELAAWGLTQDDGAMGFLHVMPAWRRHGLGRTVTMALIDDIRTAGRLPFAYIEPDNHKSIGLVTGMGFVPRGDFHWFELA